MHSHDSSATPHSDTWRLLTLSVNLTIDDSHFGQIDLVLAPVLFVFLLDITELLRLQVGFFWTFSVDVCGHL